jgi:hypothetical protein
MRVCRLLISEDQKSKFEELAIIKFDPEKASNLTTECCAMIEIERALTKDHIDARVQFVDIPDESMANFGDAVVHALASKKFKLKAVEKQ